MSKEMSKKEFFWEVVGGIVFFSIPAAFVYCLYNPHLLPSF